MEIIHVIQFMLGVPEKYLPNMEKCSFLSKVRALCNLRSAIVGQFSEVNTAHKNGDALTTIKETRNPAQMLAEKYNFTPNEQTSLSRIVMELNEAIDKEVNNVPTFENIPKEWVQELFHMPEGNTVEGVREAVKKFRKYSQSYPSRKYLNWDFAATPESLRARLFESDASLLAMMRQQHANKAVQLFDFIGKSDKVDVIVDCENSDAQRLYNSLRVMLPHINKIIFVNDAHGNALWDEFERFAPEVNIEHVKLNRLKEQKSLVDYTMVSKTFEEYYESDVRDFVLASSDSDIWALIMAIPTANVMVLSERCKSGDVLPNALTKSDIPFIFMEDVQTDSFEMMDAAMNRECTAQFAKTANWKKAVINSLKRLNIYPPEEKVQQYFNMAV